MKLQMKGFWTPIMIVLGITIIAMTLIVFQQTNSFTQVDWSAINPFIIKYAPWVVILGVAFVVFLYLRGK